MATSSLRSSSKNEVLNTRSTRSNISVAPSLRSHNNNNMTTYPPQLSNVGRKRPRELVESDDTVQGKKKKLTVAIRGPKRKGPLLVKADANSDLRPQRFASPLPPSKQTSPTTTPQNESPPRKPVKHHEKVVNGIKHELDRLKPSTADLDKGDEKRKLRSQEGTRFKSELSAYFPDYDEVIGNEPKEDHILNYDTPIIIVDSAKTSKQPSTRKTNHDYPLKQFPTELFDDLHNSHRVDFSFLDPHYGEGDPLSDAHFARLHRRPERQERAIRNTDKGRAQHEKDQVIRLLEGLQGHDWLKLMGVSGITDSKKKDYEGAREHFIRGCEYILEKFRTWREEEKRRKLEKEQAAANAEEDEDEEDDAADDADISEGELPDLGDIDASAARQLHEEAVARSAAFRSKVDRRAKVVDASSLPTWDQGKEFKSFFEKSHQRSAALSKNRRSGRSVAAWGQPIPEVSERPFELPEEFRDDDTLSRHARRKRRDRRVSRE